LEIPNTCYWWFATLNRLRSSF